MNQPNLQGMLGPGMQGFMGGNAQNNSAITPANLRTFLQQGFSRAPAQQGWQASYGAAKRAGVVCEL